MGVVRLTGIITLEISSPYNADCVGKYAHLLQKLYLNLRKMNVSNLVLLTTFLRKMSVLCVYLDTVTWNNITTLASQVSIDGSELRDAKKLNNNLYGQCCF